MKNHPCRTTLHGLIPIIAALALLLPQVGSAQTNIDGALVGRVTGGGTITVANPSTGLRRTITVDPDGSFRLASLPPGSYTVSHTSEPGVTKTQQVAVSIGVTSDVVFTSPDTVDLEVFQVSEARVNPVDFERTESSTIFDKELLAKVPVAQTAGAVALLAPGTTKGDGDFGDRERDGLISFGGSSVAENAYFINGLNVSNFRNGMSPSSIPWEFYDQFEVKTGAYSAEFGRSTGGVINATTKSGTNTFMGGISAYYAPAVLRGHNPDIYYTNADGNRQAHSINSSDRLSEATINTYLSGPIVKDKLFIYGLYTLRRNSERDAVTGGTDIDHFKDDAPFWGIKVDFTPFDGHRFEYTTFSDKADMVTTTYANDPETMIESTEVKSVLTEYLGGKNHIARYTGTFFEDFTFSALYGKNDSNRTTKSSEDEKPGIYDTRTGTDFWASGNPDLIVSDAFDEREAIRVDLEYAFDFFGNHRLRGGYDSEDNFSFSNDFYTGGYYWRYTSVTPGATVGGVTVPPGVTEVVRERIYTNGGGFKVKSSAVYLEDNWSLMNERLLLRLGLRNETFENLSATDQTFIKVDEQYAPRLGVSFDLFGDRKTKVFANFGRYHLPIASNTNIRLAGSETFTEQYYVLDGVNPDYTPIIGAKHGDLTVYSDGSIKDRERIVAQDIEPMYQDEWVVGVQQKLNNKWSAGVRGVYRDLKSAIDDVIVDHALASYAERMGMDTWAEPEAHEYVLANPGKPITYFYDIDGDGTNDEITLTAEDLGFDEAKRKYVAAEFFIERVWDSKWQAQLSYTWSQSYGNTEGWVKSDVAQDDAGITSDFDAIGLARGSYGFLPNDRRHQVKLFGAYAITPRLQVGLNSRLSSGRPINRFGVYPSSLDDVANGYGSEAFWIGGDPANGEPGTPTFRGDGGRTPWVFNLDLSVNYKPAWGQDRITFGLEVFNLFNSHKALEVRETYEEDAGVRDYRYGLPTYFQDPFSVRFNTRMEFMAERM